MYLLEHRVPYAHDFNRVGGCKIDYEDVTSAIISANTDKDARDRANKFLEEGARWLNGKKYELMGVRLVYVKEQVVMEPDDFPTTSGGASG